MADLVHWQANESSAAGHAHIKCIPEDAHEVAELDPAGDWIECIGKPSACDWCGEEGTGVG